MALSQPRRGRGAGRRGATKTDAARRP